jgi:trimethylguanosine synthase|tara:strand:- start:139 stop:1449 length:1311 start_codon:yes stop_codon:yes gene_type:complete
MSEKSIVLVSDARLYDLYFGLAFQNQLRLATRRQAASEDSRGKDAVQDSSPRPVKRCVQRFYQPPSLSSVSASVAKGNCADYRPVESLSGLRSTFPIKYVSGNSFDTYNSRPTKLSGRECAHLQGVFFLWRQAFDYEHLRHYYYCAKTMELTWSPPEFGFVPLPIKQLYVGSGNSSSNQRIAVTETSCPAEIPHVKYWLQRHRYFTLFDHGTCLDTEAWYSVTPERIAIHQAVRCNHSLIGPFDSTIGTRASHRRHVIYDLFCGVGGNAIAFARKTGAHVIAIDIDMTQLHFAARNAITYGVGFSIDFICDNSISILKGAHSVDLGTVPRPLTDMIFLSPPWGGPSYRSADSFDLCTAFVGGQNFLQLLTLALQITPNVAFFLPRNTDLRPLLAMSLCTSVATGDDAVLSFEVEKNYVNGKFKAITIYFGKLANFL